MPGTGLLGREITMTMGGVAVAGIKEKSLSIAFEGVEVTDDNSDGFRELLAEPGLKTLELTISGVTKSLELLRAFSENVSQIYAFEKTFPDGSTLSWNAQATSYALNVVDAEASQFDASFASSGEWTFVAGT